MRKYLPSLIFFIVTVGLSNPAVAGTKVIMMGGGAKNAEQLSVDNSTGGWTGTNAQDIFEEIQNAINNVSTSGLSDVDAMPGDTNDDDQIDPDLYETAYVVNASAEDQGASSTGSVKALVDEIGTDKKAALKFIHNNTSTSNTTGYSFATDIEIPANITVVVEPGAVLTLGAGCDLTVNRLESAPPVQWIRQGATGGIVFGAGAVVYPEWWGAVGDGTTDDTTAIEQCISSLGNGGKIIVSRLHQVQGADRGDYCDGVRLVRNNIIIEGLDNTSCGFKSPTIEPGFCFRDYGEILAENIRFTNLLFQGQGAADSSYWDWSSASSSAIRLYSYSNIEVDRCRFKNFSIGAFVGGLNPAIQSTNLKFHDNIQDGDSCISALGVHVYSADGIWVYNNRFNKVARSFSIEMNTGYDLGVINFHFDSNLVENGECASASNTNSYFGAHINPIGTSIARDGTITFNTFKGGKQGNAAVTNEGDIFICGDALTPGNCSNIKVTGNVCAGFTPTAGTEYAITAQYCQNVDITDNTCKDPGGAMYAIRLRDAQSCIVSNNRILGTAWSSGIQEDATLACHNMFFGNYNEDIYSFPDIATSLSTALTGLSFLNDLVTLSGIPAESTHLGTFTGTTIADNVTVKEALQVLETAIESIEGGSGMTALVSDITPQLGGDLDVNGKEIQSAGNIVFQLGDNAGVNKVSIQDSDGNEIWKVDSNGVSGVATATPQLILSDSDNTAGTAGVFGNSSGGANDVIMTIGVEDSAGESTGYIEIDGVDERVEILKYAYFASSMGLGGNAQIAGKDLGSSNGELSFRALIGGVMTEFFRLCGTCGVTHMSKPVDLLDIETAGVGLTASDGALTITGKGDGYDEALTINLDTTENTATLSSSTGVTKIDLSAMNLATTGTLQGRTVYGPDITESTAHDTTELHNVLYHATAAATVTLDAAADAGYGSTVGYRIRDAAEALLIETASGEKINVDGTALASGTGITATGAGKYVILVATTDTDGSGTDGWETWGNNGFASE
jgi:hypothetical protein